MHPVDWNNPTHPLARREPRRGERAVLRATVATPQVCRSAHCFKQQHALLGSKPS